MLFTVPIKKNSQFRQIYGNSISAACRLLVLHVRPCEPGINRLGVSVSKKVGKSVVRNRIKRLIKENYRLLEPRLNPGCELVVVARAALGVLPKKIAFYEINKSLVYLFKKQNLLKEQPKQ